MTLFTVAMTAKVALTIVGAGALTTMVVPSAGAATAPIQKPVQSALQKKSLAQKLTGKATPTKTNAAARVAAAPADSFGCRASLARIELPPPTVLLEPVVANDPFSPCTAEDASVIGLVDLSPVGTVTLLEVDTIQDRHQPAQTGDNAQAISKVADVSIGAIPGAFIRAQLVTAEAGVTCDAGQPKFGGGTALVSLSIAGQPIELPPPNTVIPLGPLGSITLREEIVGAHGVEERAIAVRTPIVNVFVAEATAGATGNPCAAGTCDTNTDPTCPPACNHAEGPDECPCPTGGSTATCPATCDHDNDADDVGCPAPCTHDETAPPASECPCPNSDDPNATCPASCDGDNDADDVGCPAPCSHAEGPNECPCPNSDDPHATCPPTCDHDNDADDSSACCTHTEGASDECPCPTGDAHTTCPPACDHDGDADDVGCPPPCDPHDNDDPKGDNSSDDCAPCRDAGEDDYRGGGPDCKPTCDDGDESTSDASVHAAPSTASSSMPECDCDTESDTSDAAMQPSSPTVNSSNSSSDSCGSNAAEKSAMTPQA